MNKKWKTWQRSLVAAAKADVNWRLFWLSLLKRKLCGITKKKKAAVMSKAKESNEPIISDGKNNSPSKFLPSGPNFFSLSLLLMPKCNPERAVVDGDLPNERERGYFLMAWLRQIQRWTVVRDHRWSGSHSIHINIARFSATFIQKLSKLSPSFFFLCSLLLLI